MIVNIGEINLGQARATQGLSLRMGYDFASHDRPLGKPTRQRLGGKLDEWRLSFSLNHHFCDPATVLQKIQATVASGEPKQLVFDYFDYQGWVTLDDVDITFVEATDNGRPLIISGTLTLNEFTGDTTLKPKAPAMRDNTQSKPVQTASTDDVQSLLPHRQPQQHLMEALIAQHKARAKIKSLDKAGHGDTNTINDNIKAVNDYFASQDWYGQPVPPLSTLSNNNANALIYEQIIIANRHLQINATLTAGQIIFIPIIDPPPQPKDVPVWLRDEESSS